MKLARLHEGILIHARHKPFRPPTNQVADVDHLVELGYLEDTEDGYTTTPKGLAYLKVEVGPDPQLQHWRGQVVLDIDVQAYDDDDAMEQVTEHVTLILNDDCSIAERRVVLRQFFGDPKAPWQGGVMAENAAHLIERALQVAELVNGEDPPWKDELQPDLHIHRRVLEDAIDHALRNAHREGRRSEKAKNKPNIRAAISVTEEPGHVAEVLRKFASYWDSKGYTQDANVLRDAAAMIEDGDLPKEPK